MVKYAILVNPGHNRVYFEASKKLAAAELNLALGFMGVATDKIAGEYLENIYYIIFEAERELASPQLQILARLSFSYACFKLCDLEKPLYLQPVALPEYQYLDGSISNILKYSGKTNELFTRLMVNIAQFSAGAQGQRLKLLDPIAGKGTSLYEALVCGYDAYGIEIAEKSANEAFQYMKKFLEIEKFKHTTTSETIKAPDKSFNAKRQSIQLARSKGEQKAMDAHHFEVVAGSSVFADKYYKKNTFDLIVGDLPYGVQHGNVSGQRQSFTRNPKELVAACVGAWHSVLKPGGALALAWNSLVLPRQQLVKLLTDGGFEVLNQGVYLEFQHRVDNSIKRDLVVAKK